MIQSSTQYHQLTSYHRHKMTGHYLDWENQPTVFKTYPHTHVLPLPRNAKLPRKRFSSILRERDQKDPSVSLSIDLEDLGRILQLTYSLTAKARHGEGDFYYRSVASAGALYPTEIYIATCGVEGLEDGLYHFSIARHCLSRLREGDLSAFLLGAIPSLGQSVPILTFFFSAVFFRSAWKYRDRSYRYHLLDTGHVIENLILALKAVNLPFDVTFDFADRRINHLLGVDEEREVALAVCHVPGSASIKVGTEIELPEMGEDFKRQSRVAEREIEYPPISEIHAAGFTLAPAFSSAPQGKQDLGLSPTQWNLLEPPEVWPEKMDYADAIVTRRSSRNYVRRPLQRNALTALLGSLCEYGPNRTVGAASYRQAVSTGFLLGDAEGFDPGFYLLDPALLSTGLVKSGMMLDQMAHICLDQGWLANAAIHFLFMANLDEVDRQWGARGYRYAMMTAGQMGERLYLAATAMSLGCCGIGAFYDPEAAELLNLNNASRLLYLVAVGPVKSFRGV